MCLVMKPLQFPPLWQYGALYTLFFSLQLLQYYAHFSNNRTNNLSTFMEMLCVLAKAGQRAECQAALLHRQLPSEVRMSNAARPLHRISQHHGGKIQRRCCRVGGEESSTLWATLPCRCPHSHGTAISVPALIKTDWIIYSVFLNAVQPIRDLI